MPPNSKASASSIDQCETFTKVETPRKGVGLGSLPGPDEAGREEPTVKYLKISVKSPYSGTERVEYVPVPDDFDPDGKDQDERDDMIEHEVWEYVEAYGVLVDESEVPEGER
jgi:hypothetical protein